MGTVKKKSDDERESPGGVPPNASTRPPSPVSYMWIDRADPYLSHKLPDTNNSNAEVPEIPRLCGGSDIRDDEHTQNKARLPVEPEADRAQNAPPPVAHGEVAKFNLENKPVKRFMDIITGPKQQIPYTSTIIEMCADLLNVLHFNRTVRKCTMDDTVFVDLVKNNVVFKNCPYVERVREAGNDPGTVEYRQMVRGLRMYFHKIGKKINRARKCLERLNVSSLLIYTVYVDAEQPDGGLSSEPVDEMFRGIVHLLDISYNKKLMYTPDYEILNEMTFAVPADTPSLAPLVQGIPRSHKGYQVPSRSVSFYRAMEPLPANIREFRYSKNHLASKENQITSRCALTRDGTVDKIYNFCRENPGSTFEVRAATGSGKTLALPPRLCGLGVVLLVQINELHVKQTVATLLRNNFACEVRTERYAKFGFLPVQHRKQIFYPATFANPEVEPALKRSENYEPMRAHRLAELYVCTYKVLRQLIKNADYPDLMIFDDVRSDDRDKDLAMFSLLHARLPENMIIGGLSSSDHTSGRFTFDEVVEKRQAGATLLLNPTTPTPHPVHPVPEFCEQYLRTSNINVIQQLAKNPDSMIGLLQRSEREDLLPVICDPGNQELFKKFSEQYELSELEDFAIWLPDHFHRLLTNADLLTQTFEALAIRTQRTAPPPQ